MKIRITLQRIAQRVRGFDARHAATMAWMGITEGWYTKGDEQSGNRRKHLLYNYTANSVANLIGANFLTGLLLYIGADDGFIGLISMITFGANLLQLFAPLLLERFPSRKKLLVGLKCVLHLFNIVFIGMIPFFPVGQQGQLALIFIGILAVNVINALIAPGMSIWHVQFLPQRVRTHYFPILSMSNGIVVALVTLGASAIVDAFKGAGVELWGLTALRIAAVFVAVYDVSLLARMKEYPYERDEKSPTLFQMLIEPFRHTRYLRIVAISFLWNMVANIPGAYYTVYLLKDVQVNYSFITLVSLVNIPILIFMMPLFSRLLRKYSWLKTLNASLAFYLLHYILLALVSQGMLMLYPLAMILAYAMAVGINLSFTGIPYINIPKKNQTIYIAFYSTLANLGALLGATIGRTFVTNTDGLSFDLIGFHIGNKQALVVLTALAMLMVTIAVWLLRRGVDDTQ